MRTKVELWMLFPDPLFARMLPTSGEIRAEDDRTITEMFGDPHWHAIWLAKLAGDVGPAEARSECVNLMRWRLENALGYTWTHQLEVRNTGGVPIYHMIFATDSRPGHDIMSHLYNQAAAEFPAMAEEARLLRERRQREAYANTSQLPLSWVDLLARAGRRVADRRLELVLQEGVRSTPALRR